MTLEQAQEAIARCAGVLIDRTELEQAIRVVVVDEFKKAARRGILRAEDIGA